ncbi:hypothetical protein KOI35_04720 [Actinoplanes bogorensis]|uniref:Uncharacterized protein n=1 Tax=Paractinoplanes bogorensis TaxID=1610840 RepID=A0ABS5YLH3_9ACTN|nr:hypothetical protein [Actinoplanes bogorensis]MBU2662805.1 hypothetical protein [Actinoplanes bogorensis]
MPRTANLAIGVLQRAIDAPDDRLTNHDQTVDRVGRARLGSPPIEPGASLRTYGLRQYRPAVEMRHPVSPEPPFHRYHRMMTRAGPSAKDGIECRLDHVVRRPRKLIQPPPERTPDADLIAHSHNCLMRIADRVTPRIADRSSRTSGYTIRRCGRRRHGGRRLSRLRRISLRRNHRRNPAGCGDLVTSWIGRNGASRIIAGGEAALLLDVAQFLGMAAFQAVVTANLVQAPELVHVRVVVARLGSITHLGDFGSPEQ